MTLRVNTSFGTALANARASNIAWSTAFKNGLGTNRRVICVRHADAATPEENVFATGTVFRNAAITGEMSIVAGVIAYYGDTSDLTVALAADLATGKSVLRIEGNGNWIEGTLGLVGSNCDFVFPANPTTTNSIAVSPNTRISPPPFLPSGTGYTPPPLNADAPAYVSIEDWTNPSSVVEAGRIYFNTRIKNWVFEDAAVAAEIGDVRVTQSNGIVLHGQFEFGATLFSCNPAVNSVPGKVLHEVLIGCKPTEENWPRYPRHGGYRKGVRTINGEGRSYGVTDTFPPPFKAKICTASGTVLFTHEMHDGLPINSPQLSDVPTKTKAIRPHWNCGQMLPWQSEKPKLSSKARHYFPGVHAQCLRPSLNKSKDSSNAPYPLYEIGQPGNSSGLWFAMAKWPLPCGEAAFVADEATRKDPYLYNIGPTLGESAGWWTQPWMKTFFNVPDSDLGSLEYGMGLYQGWGYEPGSWSAHDFYTGPGGMRIDRSVIPTPIALHMTKADFVHMRDGTPIEEMVDHWNKAYFNEPYFWITDARTLASVPVEEVIFGDWAFGRSYYGGLDYYTAGGMEKAIPIFAIGQGKTSEPAQPHFGAFTDTNYRMPWNGASIDTLHNYSCPGWVTLLYNSPMYAYANKMRYMASIMCHLGTRDTYADDSAHSYFGRRNHAWRILQHTMMWKLASDHPLGIKRAAVEERLIGELTAVYNYFTVPIHIQNNQEPLYKTLRNLGVYVEYAAATGGWQAASFGLTYYMAHALQLMRQTGLFRRMYDYSEITREALLTIIKLLDVGSIAFFNQTNGNYIGQVGSVYGGYPYLMIGDNKAVNPIVPESWAEYKAKVCPQDGQGSWIRRADGTLKSPDSSEQLRSQWPGIRKAYFPDIPCDYDVDMACNIVDGFHNEWAAEIARLESNGTPKNAIRNYEYKLPVGYGRILPPQTLEP